MESSNRKVITCKAAVVWKEGEMLKIEEIQVDPPKSNEVRIKMLFASLCHSDIIAFNGFPIVFINANYVIKVDPQKIPLQHTSLLCCGFTTGYGATWREVHVEKGSTVAVLGLGVVGLGVVEGARSQGASKTIGVDINELKRGKGEAFGMTDFINPKEFRTSVSETIKDVTEGLGVNYVFECTGIPSMLNEAIEASKLGIGTIVLIGVGNGLSRDINLIPLLCGRTLKGSSFGGIRLHSDLPTLLHKCANKSFFIGGGSNPSSILAGFDHTTLSTALNKYTRSSGLIVHLSGSHDTNIWSNFLDLEPHQRLSHLKRIVNFDEEPSPKEEKSTWSFRKFVFTLLNGEDVIERVNHKAPSIYNLYNKKPDFKNDYGWSKKVDSSDYSPLEQSGNDVYLVNLSTGSLMAPHINPSAIEYGIVLRGTGRIQIVYPNGILAMNAKVREGDVFWVPRYFPFCQIESTNSPLEFFGFTTLAKRNNQQFLLGKNSLMQSLRGPEFAAAFGIDEKRLKRIANAQR
ncbi:hypothetical protein KY290_019638 [Solanum tuberosum]|uniref:Cupin type-1 domain-containing protein n=1 Tax=Solanum tuberosum TaxID=4113 RepID=A0ABQ7VHK7_SOLTU|nr:hypothetical protein KY290_019638 [Solanum tuberosum]